MERQEGNKASHDPPVVVHEEPECKYANDGESAQDKEDSDDVYNYNCALVSGLLFMNFLDAIAEGDGNVYFVSTSI